MKKRKKKVIIDIPEIFISMNSQYLLAPLAGRKVVLTPLARGYKDSVGWEARNVFKGDPIEGLVKVSIWYWFSGNRKRDIQNDKLTLDALEGIVIRNDSQVKELHLYKRRALERSRTKIIIEEL